MNCPSDLMIDRLILGELDDPRAVEAHLAGCRACRGRRDDFTRSASELLAAHPSLPSRPAPVPAPVRRRWRIPAVGFAVACAAALALLLTRATDPAAGLRAKGGFAFDVYVKRKSGAVEKLEPGGMVRPRESIRFRVSLPRAGYVSVVSIDPAGQRSSYLPASSASRRLPAGPAQELDGSVELDDTLGDERLIALFCADGADVEPRCTAATLAFVKAR